MKQQQWDSDQKEKKMQERNIISNPPRPADSGQEQIIIFIDERERNWIPVKSKREQIHTT